jgi:prepilin-type N-terminal cleavage/methylation domain-containing protein
VTPDSVLARPVRRRHPSLAGLGTCGDAGVTLAELVVSMTVMSIFMSIFTAAAVQMFRFESDTQTATSAQNQIHIAYLRLDKDIRYAVGISTPDAAYVEYLRTDEGVPMCTELWLDSADRQLKTRTWVEGSTPGPNWSTLASEASSTQPFTLLAPVAPFVSQRLRLNLIVGPAADAGSAKVMDMTFTALNTSAATSSGAVCAEGRLNP